MEEEKELDEVLDTAMKEAKEAESSRSLYEAKMRFLGRTGIVMNFMKRMKDISPENRPAFGKKVNAIRDRLEAEFAAFEAKLKKRELEKKLAEESIDVTMP
ncbi:MAG: phenylalanine--tRNA ligase subunit alpha, partial [Clostridiales bacterium]|nr:phenylalanine--tRNA ligase subunit alpha [Clostridiales bacterium]